MKPVTAKIKPLLASTGPEKVLAEMPHELGSVINCLVELQNKLAQLPALAREYGCHDSRVSHLQVLANRIGPRIGDAVEMLMDTRVSLAREEV